MDWDELKQAILKSLYPLFMICSAVGSATGLFLVMVCPALGMLLFILSAFCGAVTLNYQYS